MASPSEKLAQSLEVLQALMQSGKVAIRSADLTRLHRERLVKQGFLQEVVRGWYIQSRPDEKEGDSTAWYASFWKFCAGYLDFRFNNDWILTPEQSISLLVENQSSPRQLLVRAPKAGNNILALLHGSSLLDVVSTLPEQKDRIVQDGIQLFALPAALVDCQPAFYTQNPTDIRAALAMIRDASEVLPLLLDGGKSVVAGRLAGAFRSIGRESIADDIVKTMKTADYNVREVNPFEALAPVVLSQDMRSPYVNRIHLMWQQMRPSVIEAFPSKPDKPVDAQVYMDRVEEIYLTDAYHSLSIEGYRVTPELIERVRSGNWNPEGSEQEKNQRDALAARGYWQAFQSVKLSVEKVLNGTLPGDAAAKGHRDWYRELFGPSVVAGILKPMDLAGYRTDQVYLRGSMHVPPRAAVVRDAMPALFALLRDEQDPAVRVVLGHFMFVYIHPYMDGNGRMGRFLMNVMLASGGYPWVVIPVEERSHYMTALESASANHDIAPFTTFLSNLVVATMKHEQA